jgi:adenylate cyclase
MFSDIRGFTAISELLSPEALIELLNEFLTRMTRCIEWQEGIVDKFIGDAVMAVFTLPEPRPDDADRAVQAALMMRDELQRFHRRLPSDLPRLSIGIGLHAGPVVAGLIGSPQKRSYTVIGDVVNTASRLEGMTKTLGASILVSEAVVSRLADPGALLLRPLGRFAPKGRRDGVRVFDVMGERDGSPEARAWAREIEMATAALEAFEGSSFARAAGAFETLAKEAAGSSRRVGYELLATSARSFASKPPDAAWQGEIKLEEK